MITVACPACHETVRLYTTGEAAEYLGLSVAAIKYHVHTAHTLTPQKVGHSLVFSGHELDTFKSIKRSPGRPPSSS